MIELTHASAERLEFCSRESARPLLVSAAGFGLMALVPLAPGAPLSSPRVAATLLLAVASALLFRAGWRHRKRFSIDLLQGSLLKGPTTVSIAGARAIALSGSAERLDETARLSYRAELVLAGGRRELILEREEPAGVLRDLGEALRFLNVPVQCGWGLPIGATPWLPRAADPDPSDPPSSCRGPTEIQAPLRANQGAAALAAGVGATLVGSIISFMLISRLRRGLDVAPLSFVLPAVSLLFVYAVSGLVATARIRIRKNGTLSIERRALGVTWQKTTLPSRAIRTAYAVNPGTRCPCHVVLQTESGPVGIPSVGDGARALERALRARDSR